MNTNKPDNKIPSDQNKWKGWTKSLIVWLVILAVVIIFAQYFSQMKTEPEITYSQFMDLVEEGTVESIVFEEKDITGELRKEVSLNIDGRSVTLDKFKLHIPFDDPDLVRELKGKGISVNARKVTSNWLQILIGVLPWLLLVFLWFGMIRQMRGGQKGIFSFGKSRAKTISPDRTKVTFDNVAGVEEAKQDLEEIIEYLKNPLKFSRLGGKVPKGVLLVGPPGTGKTLLARAVAGEAEVPFFSMSGSDFVEMFVGVGASRVRDLFLEGKKNSPCIIFIDEIDAVGRQRGTGLGGGHDEREQTLNQLLSEMDGFEPNEGVIMLAATNRPDVLDPALLRPGRFDRRIIIPRPDVRGRWGILKVHTAKIPLSEDVDLKLLAKGTPGLSGADLANIVNEAALLAARKDKNQVDMIDFEEAKDKVMMGAERRSMVIMPEEKKITAYHEAGHALVSKLIPGSDPVHKVTIIPRGLALGVTHYLPQNDRWIYPRTYLEAKLVHLLGGRAAETVVFKDISTGAGNDIQQATELARKMVTQWGMSEKLGPLDVSETDEEVFLGRELVRGRRVSEQTALLVDEEIKRLVTNALDKALSLIKENLEVLHKLAEALLEQEILDADQIDEIMGIAKPNDSGEAKEAPQKA
ncbi:ATP-dependent zinc metalloprotease FtsH [bacterium]|nr:ATP-dependent zinc metalloprotease FtsH [bacterium]